MTDKTAGELIQELVDIHCRTMIRFQRRQELLQEQDEDDSKFDIASSLLKPTLAKLARPIHFQHGWGDHYVIQLDTDIDLISVELMFEVLDLDGVDDRLLSDDCLATIDASLDCPPSESEKVDGYQIIRNECLNSMNAALGTLYGGSSSNPEVNLE